MAAAKANDVTVVKPSDSKAATPESPKKRAAPSPTSSRKVARKVKVVPPRPAVPKLSEAEAKVVNRFLTYINDDIDWMEDNDKHGGGDLADDNVWDPMRGYFKRSAPEGVSPGF